MNIRSKKTALAIVPAALALFASTTFIAPAQAGFLNRHHKAAGLAAGLAAHHMATHAHGGFMHKHPIMTGIVAGGVANHMLKKHAH